MHADPVLCQLATPPAPLIFVKVSIEIKVSQGKQTYTFVYPKQPTLGYIPTEHISSLRKWLYPLLAKEFRVHLLRSEHCGYLDIVGLNIPVHT